MRLILQSYDSEHNNKFVIRKTFGEVKNLTFGV
jgi:hypothetical protein